MRASTGSSGIDANKPVAGKGLPKKAGYIIKTRTSMEEDEKGYTRISKEEYYEKIEETPSIKVAINKVIESKSK